MVIDAWQPPTCLGNCYKSNWVTKNSHNNLHSYILYVFRYFSGKSFNVISLLPVNCEVACFLQSYWDQFFLGNRNFMFLKYYSIDLDVRLLWLTIELRSWPGFPTDKDDSLCQAMISLITQYYLSLVGAVEPVSPILICKVQSLLGV